jgi:hypothetical protein
LLQEHKPRDFLASKLQDFTFLLKDYKKSSSEKENLQTKKIKQGKGKDKAWFFSSECTDERKRTMKQGTFYIVQASNNGWRSVYIYGGEGLVWCFRSLGSSCFQLAVAH